MEKIIKTQSGLKVGILTFHDGINHGAFIQAYSLYRYLEAKGCNVKIINYRPLMDYFNEFKVLMRRGRFSLKILVLKKIITLWNYQKLFNKTPYSSKIEKLNTKDFDIVILGSDEIWNLNSQTNIENFTYFGAGIESKKIISYAASFGSYKFHNPFPSKIPLLIDRLSRISVRDYNSKEILKKITKKKIDVVLDPAFFLPNFPMEKIFDKNFVAIYGWCGKKELEKLREHKVMMKKTFVSLSYYNKHADKNLINICPFKWLSRIFHADFVITSTFHGVVIAILYHKQFIVLKNDKITKIKTILDILGLKDRIVDGIELINEKLDKKINYQNVQKKLEAEKKSSTLFLDNILNEQIENF